MPMRHRTMRRVTNDSTLHRHLTELRDPGWILPRLCRCLFAFGEHICFVWRWMFWTLRITPAIAGVSRELVFGFMIILLLSMRRWWRAGSKYLLQTRLGSGTFCGFLVLIKFLYSVCCFVVVCISVTNKNRVLTDFKINWSELNWTEVVEVHHQHNHYLH